MKDIKLFDLEVILVRQCLFVFQVLSFLTYVSRYFKTVSQSGIMEIEAFHCDV